MPLIVMITNEQCLERKVKKFRSNVYDNEKEYILYVNEIVYCKVPAGILL